MPATKICGKASYCQLSTGSLRTELLTVVSTLETLIRMRPTAIESALFMSKLTEHGTTHLRLKGDATYSSPSPSPPKFLISPNLSLLPSLSYHNRCALIFLSRCLFSSHYIRKSFINLFAFSAISGFIEIK